MLGLLLGFAIGVALVQVLMSYVARDFMDALTQRDRGGFRKNLWLYLGTFALAVPIGVFYRFTEEKLALLWRQWMTRHLLKRYFNNRAYYRSPRIGHHRQSGPAHCGGRQKLHRHHALSFLLITLNSCVTLLAFIGVLWSISGTLVLTLLVYAVAGTAISILIGTAAGRHVLSSI